jgi:hypothetical protein
VQFGLLGMLMHGAPLESRAWLAAFGGDQAFQFFGIDATGGRLQACLFCFSMELMCVWGCCVCVCVWGGGARAHDRRLAGRPMWMCDPPWHAP